ncbi:MAG: WG repeat-containing protein [Oscillospiraceae bacterium]|nr:WG repeat-containing protein [Oscillospiraceae bacterium]
MKRILLILLIIATVAFAAACNAPQSKYLPEIKHVPPNMRWDVKTDFSVLAPYNPNSMYSRLSDGAMPQLIPSDDYGLLLPYKSVNVQSDGSAGLPAYGFVTTDGVLVTDLVYYSVKRASSNLWYFSINWGEQPPPDYYPAYLLSIALPREDDDTAIAWYPQTKQAVCALDGSWITAFDYDEVFFTENAILLMRGFYEGLDIDVYDYDGNFLHNMQEHDWVQYVGADQWASGLFYGVYNGYGHVAVNSPYGNTAFVNIQTGQAKYTEYYSTSIGQFADGLAPAYSDGLWGFINQDFEMVIEPQYTSTEIFFNGHALVRTDEVDAHVIDTKGEVLFSFEKGWHVWVQFGIHNADDTIYFAHAREHYLIRRYFTYDFKEIIPPEGADETEDSYVNSIQGGNWLSFGSYPHGTYLFRYGEELFFADIDAILYADNEYIIYQKHFSYNDFQTGVRTFDGRQVVPLQENGKMITPVRDENGIRAFIVNDDTRNFGFYQPVARPYKPSSYKLIDINGTVIMSGLGTLTYDKAVGLYELSSPDFFAWLDADGNTLILIPLMSYALD